MSFKCWVLGDALRHISIYVMDLHSSTVQFASVAWKFIAMADLFILERFQTHIPVVWDVKPCILLCTYQSFGRALILQLRPSWTALKVQLVFFSETLCPIHRSTPRHVPEDLGIFISSAVITRNVAVQRKFVALWRTSFCSRFLTLRLLMSYIYIYIYIYIWH